jgi:hypothetical protein
MARPAAGLVPVANDPYEKWSHQTAHRSFTWPIASRAPSIFSVPRKDLSHDFSSQVALEASYHAAKHFFSIGPFRLQFSTSYLFQIWSLFRMSHPSSRYRRDFLNRSGFLVSEPPNFSSGCIHHDFDESPWDLHIGDPQAAAAE